jgi:methylthioribose-1-phosphate isomerase
MPVVPFLWTSDRLDLLDQRLLPHRTEILSCRTAEDVAEAIRSMAVRGAPAIGCCAAYGLALAGSDASSLPRLEQAAQILKGARPTAVNLAWAVDRVMNAVRAAPTRPGTVLAEARAIQAEDVAVNRAIGRHGAALLPADSMVLTHCNTGALATAGHGTALGIIRDGFNAGRVKRVLVDETRPFLQGARLTAWELTQDGIPFDLITDSMAAHVMKTGKVDAVFVGCDRVAANGDTANKIGTYGLAVLARYTGVPFYVAMPLSTFDAALPSGEGIPIEERSPDEVTSFAGVRVAPEGATARHPAFDVTPADLITAFVTEAGVVRPPFAAALAILKSGGVAASV